MTELLLLVFLALATASAQSSESKYTSSESAKQQPVQKIKMAVTGIPGLEELERNFKPLEQLLSKLTGYQFTLYPLSNRTVVVSSLQNGNVDLVLFGPAEYVIASSKTKLKIICGLSRPNYFSAIVSLKSSGLRKLGDLRGKSLGLGDFGSTAYYLAPLDMVAAAGLDPLSDIKAVSLAKQVAWESLKRGDIDALGLKADQLTKFIEKDNSVSDADLFVLGRSGDLPPDLIVASGHLPAKVAERIKLIIKHNSETFLAAILKGAENQKYAGMKVLPDLKPEEYDSVRGIFARLDYPEFSQLYKE